MQDGNAQEHYRMPLTNSSSAIVGDLLSATNQSAQAKTGREKLKTLRERFNVITFTVIEMFSAQKESVHEIVRDWHIWPETKFTIRSAHLLCGRNTNMICMGTFDFSGLPSGKTATPSPSNIWETGLPLEAAGARLLRGLMFKAWVRVQQTTTGYFGIP